MASGDLTHRLHVMGVKRKSIAKIMGVFQNNQPGSGEMNVGAADGSLKIFQCELAVRVGGYRIGMYATECCRSALFK